MGKVKTGVQAVTQKQADKFGHSLKNVAVGIKDPTVTREPRRVQVITAPPELPVRNRPTGDSEVRTHDWPVIGEMGEWSPSIIAEWLPDSLRLEHEVLK